MKGHQTNKMKEKKSKRDTVMMKVQMMATDDKGINQMRKCFSHILFLLPLPVHYHHCRIQRYRLSGDNLMGKGKKRRKKGKEEKEGKSEERKDEKKKRKTKSEKNRKLKTEKKRNKRGVGEEKE